MTTESVSKVLMESRDGVGKISIIIDDVAESVTESSASARQTLAAAEALSELSIKLKKLVNDAKAN